MADDGDIDMLQGEFECTKCGQCLPRCELARECRKVGNKSALSCVTCTKSYKGLTRRWQKNSKLKSWWAAKPKVGENSQQA
eukprot:1902462-Pyramimonas_sp.AAC.1